MRDPLLTARAKAMRTQSTEPEARLWAELRAKRFHSVKFRRQKVVGGYIVDFAARDPMVVIELDGESHAGCERRDERRSAELEAHGYRVVRFTNHEVMSNLDGVLTSIESLVGSPPLPTLSPEGERAS